MTRTLPLVVVFSACHLMSGVEDFEKVGAPTGGGSVVVGETCVSHGECQTGACSDGLCCDVVCDGPCLACNLPGSVGTCVAHPAGENPENGCSAAERCSGDGACVLMDGHACTLGEQCLSGHCPADDGVCCDAPCDGACETCSASTSQKGTCLAVEAGSADSACPSGFCHVDGRCCGEPVEPTLGQSCPAGSPCVGGCADGVCRIEANVQDAYKEATIVCPPGLHCVIDCKAKASCEAATIACPAGHGCTLVCADVDSSCKGATVSCDGDGPCAVDCQGGNACDDLMVECGANRCAATCTGLDSGKKPSLACGSACSCEAC